MPIEHRKGATVITGDSQHYFRLAALKGAVSLEMAGIRVSRRLPVVWKSVKAEFNLVDCKTKTDVYKWLCAEVDRLRPLQEHIIEEDGRTKREVGGQEVN